MTKKMIFVLFRKDNYEYIVVLLLQFEQKLLNYKVFEYFNCIKVTFIRFFLLTLSQPLFLKELANNTRSVAFVSSDRVDLFVATAL